MATPSIARLGHVGLHVNDLEKQKAFYRDVLGMPLTKTIDLPGGMVDAEFEAIWAQVKAELEREGASPEDEGKSEDELKAEYRTIAERRVRLGLLLAEVGDKAELKITDDEMSAALVERVRQFPGQEKMVIDYYRQNPGAMMELRGPIFENKVVDYVIELAKVEDKTVTPEELAEMPPADL